MFCSRKTVLTATLLTLVTLPTSASPLPEVESWIQPVRLLWQSVLTWLDGEVEAPIEKPSSTSEKSLGWIDPSGLNGEAPSSPFSAHAGAHDGDADDGGGMADFHGWIDPSGLKAPESSDTRR